MASLSVVVLDAVQQEDLRRENATQVFEEVSRLLDKRLYRQRRLFWALRAEAGQGMTWSDETLLRLKQYQEVLFDWNDGINRNLALIQHHFSKGLRDELDGQIGREFVELGRICETVLKTPSTPQKKDSVRHQEQLLSSIATRVYNYNIKLLEFIQQGRL